MVLRRLNLCFERGGRKGLVCESVRGLEGRGERGRRLQLNGHQCVTGAYGFDGPDGEDNAQVGQGVGSEDASRIEGRGCGRVDIAHDCGANGSQ